MDGKGTYTWPDGSKYQGDYKDNKKHGNGIYTYTDGSKYECVYKEDKKHGKGIYTDSNGKSVSQNWSSGQLLR